MEVNHARESVNAINEVSLPKTYVRLSTNVRGSRMSMSVWHAGWQDNNPPTKAHLLTWARTFLELWYPEIQILLSQIEKELFSIQTVQSLFDG